MAKTWLVTGAARGLGAALVRSALSAGDRVVATARDRTRLARTFGPDSDRLMTAELDVACAADAEAVVGEVIDRFGRIDVLVNNAGYGHLGLFEELSAEDAAAQFATNVFGVFNVCRAVLPAMRSARAGHIINISSIVGLVGRPGASIYSASKHAIEGFSESLAIELAPFGIDVTIVAPGQFRTEFFDGSSLRLGSRTIDDYSVMNAEHRAYYAACNGRQAGDPEKLADMIVHLATEARPPLRVAAGSDAAAALETKTTSLLAGLAKWRHLSASTDY